MRQEYGSKRGTILVPAPEGRSFPPVQWAVSANDRPLSIYLTKEEREDMEKFYEGRWVAPNAPRCD